MAFNWEEYLRLAKELSQNATDEAALRSAISRAYYGVFCKARNMLQRRNANVFTGTAEDHSKVWDAFRSQGGNQKLIGDFGMQLRKYRNQVDYDNEVRNLPLLAQKSIEKAEILVAHLKTQPGGMS